MKRVVLFLIILSISLFAHRVNVFTDYEKDSLYLSSYFPNGDPCVNCDVKIFSDEKLLKQLKTNSKGELNVSIDKKSLKVVVDASMGHKVIKNIVLEDKKIKKSSNTEEIKNDKLEKLKQENKKLKLKIESLQEQLSFMNLIKIIFSLFIIAAIFIILKRVKK
ncbi:MAG: hypothetical protein ACQERD_08855 [Campylobacterota bacterium]